MKTKLKNLLIVAIVVGGVLAAARLLIPERDVSSNSFPVADLYEQSLSAFAKSEFEKARFFAEMILDPKIENPFYQEHAKELLAEIDARQKCKRSGACVDSN